MDLTSLACNECGAPLRVAAEARFVTCGHCSMQLEIRRDGAACWTQVAGELEGRIARLEGAQRARRRRWRLLKKRRAGNDEDSRNSPAVALAVIGGGALLALIEAGPVYFLVGAGIVAVTLIAVLVVHRRKDGGRTRHRTVNRGR